MVRDTFSGMYPDRKWMDFGDIYTDDKFKAELMRLLLDAVHNGINLSGKRSRIQIDWGSTNKRAEEWVINYIHEIVNYIDNKTRTELRNAIAQYDATQKKIIEVGKRFFDWAKQNHPKEFDSLNLAWLERLRSPRVRDSGRDHEYVSQEEILQLTSVPNDEGDLALLRDKAAAALLFLSGARASALTTFPISAVDQPARTLRQWPEMGVATKNGKHATTFLLPIPELLSVVKTWDDLVRSKLPPATPWCTPISAHWGDQSLEGLVPGKNRHQALDKRLRRLFNLACLPYKSAHKFRHGHAVYGLHHAQTMADYKAVSINLMHEDIKITDQIYAPILNEEVAKRIAGLSNAPVRRQYNELVAQFHNLDNNQLAQALLAIADRLAR